MIKEAINKYKALNPSSKRVAKGLGVISVALIGIGVLNLLNSAPPPSPTEKEKALFNQELTSEGDKELSDRILIDRQINEVNERLSIELEALKQQNAELRSRITETDGRINSLNIPVDSDSPAYPYPPSYPSYPSAPNSPQQPGTPTPEIKVEVRGGIRRVTPPPQVQPQSSTAPVGKYNYFPSTTLIKGVLLNGLYAPTLSKGQDRPHPAIIRVDDLTSLPNELERNIEGCRLLGEAYGELSDNRVHIRLEKLACTTKDGKAFLDDAVKGVVFGEDGIVGIPGELRANFNEMLITSFFMESLAGLGSAVRGATTTTIVSDEGVSQEYIEGSGSDKFGKIMLAAGGEGMGKGFEMIAEFYLNILNEMTPVIKINGGREIEITFTEGIELRLQENNWTWEDILL
jgi:conjugal transfer pilus assembly protein TraB